MSVLLEGGIVLTMDGGKVIRDGSVLVHGKKIIAVGKSGDVRCEAERIIDCRNKIIMPGLVDTHIHLAQALIRGSADDLPLIKWLNERVWPLQSTYDEDLGAISTELCIAEMIRSGTTSFVESGLHRKYGLDGIARVVERTGIRGVLSKLVMDRAYYADHRMYGGMIEDKGEAISEARRMIDRWHDGAGGRIKVWFGARTPGACSPELYTELGAMAEELNVGVTLHLAEVREDVRFMRGEYGMSPVEFMESCGLNNGRTILAHCVWLGERDIKLMKANVAHCPASNLKLASGIAPVVEMLKNGVNVSLGCDGAPCNNSYDMVREMYLASLLQKGQLLDPEALPANEALKLATLNGAEAAGFHCGSITEGKLADIITINLKKSHLMPLRDPVSAVVYSAKGSDVCDVLVDGKVLMENRVLKTIDEWDLLRMVERKGLNPDERLTSRKQNP